MIKLNYNIKKILLLGLFIAFPGIISAQWNNSLHFSWWEHDRVIVPNSPELFPFVLNSGTLEMWFKPDSVLKSDTHDPDYTYLFSKNLSGNVEGDLGIAWKRGDGDLQCFIQDGNVTQDVYPNITVWEPKWYHIAYVWDVDDTMKVFINGVKSADVEPNEEGEVCIPVYGGSQIIVIGSGATNLLDQRYETFRGSIDEVRISATARYKDSFTPAAQPFEPDAYTIALWHFDEGEGNIANDATGNGFNGILGDPDSANYAQPEWVKVEKDMKLVINEVLVDPSTDKTDTPEIEGDANGDGIREAQQDEFVELFNITNEPLDLTGWKIGDDERVNFQFPDGYIMQPLSFVTIFGGGDVSNIPGYDADPLKTRVIARGDSVGNGLANGGDYVVILSPDGNHDMYFGYGSVAGKTPTSDAVAGVSWEFELSTAANASNDNSITRSPDVNLSIADPFVEHNTVSDKAFSPNTTIDGYTSLQYHLNLTTVGAGTVTIDPQLDSYSYGALVNLQAIPSDGYVFAGWEGDEISLSNPLGLSIRGDMNITVNFVPAFAVEPTIIVNEMLADPKDDPILGDANGDAVRSSIQDEFVELVNVSDNPIDLTGYQMGDDEMITFTFPNGYIMQPGQIITFFGGGDVTNVPGYSANPLETRVFVGDSIGVGNGLANGGDFFLMLSPDGSYDLYAGYGSKYNSGPPVTPVVDGISFEIRIETSANASNDNSITRNPDGDITKADPFVEHFELNSKYFTPGQTTDGNNSLVTGIKAEPGINPTKYKLGNNYPNPFNPATTINFELPKSSQVNLTIYNALGQEVITLVNGFIAAGAYNITWNGTNSYGASLPSGVYIYKISAGNFVSSKKMMYIK